MAAETGTGPRDALVRARTDALDLAGRVGAARVREHLQKAEEDLLKRLAGIAPDQAPFTEVRLKVTLSQVRAVLRQLAPGMTRAVVDTGLEAADGMTGGIIEYMRAADREFRGVGVQPLAIHEASVLDVAREGARSSILRRLVMGEGPAKPGVMQRYGVSVIGFFEEELRTSLLARRSWEETRDAITERSPFLKEAPASWADRIIRTESMGAANRAAHEANAELEDQLGDAVKILSATFDDRTAADSYAVHGQVRHVSEPFETWYGPMMHPPARPNDREIVVPHRIAWPIPKYLAPKKRGEVVARWAKEKRKGRCPPTPLITTIPFNQFGREPEPRKEEPEVEKPKPKKFAAERTLPLFKQGAR